MTKRMKERIARRQALWAAMRREYGHDFVVVHRPAYVPYFITSSGNCPPKTKRILKALLRRWS